MSGGTAGSTQETTPGDPQRAPSQLARVPGGIPRELPVSPAALTPAGGGVSGCLPCPVPAQEQTRCPALGAACWEGRGQSRQSGRSQFPELQAHQVSPSFRPSSSSAPPCCPSPLTPTHHRLPSPPGTASQCHPPHRPPTPDFLPCGASWACVPHPPTPLGCRCHLLDDNAPEHGPAPHSDLAPSVYRTLTSHLPATPKPRSALIVRSWTRSHAKSTPCQAFHNPADHTHCSAASTPRPPPHLIHLERLPRLPVPPSTSLPTDHCWSCPHLPAEAHPSWPIDSHQPGCLPSPSTPGGAGVTPSAPTGRAPLPRRVESTPTDDLCAVPPTHTSFPAPARLVSVLPLTGPPACSPPGVTLSNSMSLLQRSSLTALPGGTPLSGLQTRSSVLQASAISALPWCRDLTTVPLRGRTWSAWSMAVPPGPRRELTPGEPRAAHGRPFPREQRGLASVQQS